MAAPKRPAKTRRIRSGIEWVEAGIRAKEAQSRPS
jgi:hypothetical protein